jgi:hypothetical protein
MLERGRETTWAIGVRSIRMPEVRMPATEQDPARVEERSVQPLVLRNSVRQLEPPTAGHDLTTQSVLLIADRHSITLDDRKTAQWGHVRFHGPQARAEISMVGR